MLQKREHTSEEKQASVPEARNRVSRKRNRYVLRELYSLKCRGNGTDSGGSEDGTGKT